MARLFAAETASVGLVEDADLHRDYVELARPCRESSIKAQSAAFVGAFLLEATVNEISATTALDGDVHQTQGQTI